MPNYKIKFFISKLLSFPKPKSSGLSCDDLLVRSPITIGGAIVSWLLLNSLFSQMPVWLYLEVEKMSCERVFISSSHGQQRRQPLSAPGEVGVLGRHCLQLCFPERPFAVISVWVLFLWVCRVRQQFPGWQLTWKVFDTENALQFWRLYCSSAP